MENINHIIVIGASAGGLSATSDLISQLPASIDAAIFIVLHISKNSMAEVIRTRIQKDTLLYCKIAEHDETIKNGYVYIAPPDKHLFVKQGFIIITQGPHENRWRPSIDVLFRSAAVAYSAKVIGIVLTGLLDDGTSGMSAIKRSGGTCIVQEPSEAEFEDMPQNVLNNVEVDYRLSINDMPYVLDDIFTKPSRDAVVPKDLQIENGITERMSSSISDLAQIATPTPFICPDCGGAFWKIEQDKDGRLRCHTGHVYTQHLLLETQAQALEESLWVSIRMLEERRNLLLTSSEYDKQTHNTKQEAAKKDRADQLKTHIERLKALMITINNQSHTNK